MYLQIPVGAAVPIQRRCHPVGHFLIKSGAFDGVGHRRQENIGVGLFQVIGRGFNIAHLFPFVAKHDKHAHLNACVLQQLVFRQQVIHRCFAFHGV